ncbi:hypothetical protein GF340_02490 [Candidatus Peregrinibacteria bacterium]|nr:hypothetical protein [Candidatus Peregrinibacteria bacterium]
MLKKLTAISLVTIALIAFAGCQQITPDSDINEVDTNLETNSSATTTAVLEIKEGDLGVPNTASASGSLTISE